MPTFDFQCAACDHIFEFTRPFGSSVKPKCPACSSKKTVKLIAPPAVHFKGSGWYKNDSRKGGQEVQGTEGAKEVPSKADEKKSEKPKTESKPAETKKETAPKKKE